MRSSNFRCMKYKNTRVHLSDANNRAAVTASGPSSYRVTSIDKNVKETNDQQNDNICAVGYNMMLIFGIAHG